MAAPVAENQSLSDLLRVYAPFPLWESLSVTAVGTWKETSTFETASLSILGIATRVPVEKVKPVGYI